MANKWAQGKYVVKNPQKYVGLAAPTFRSSWELNFMMFADANPNVLQWASESIRIPYRNPLTGKQSIYVPDFFIVYQDKDGNQKAELIEVKPLAQSRLSEGGSVGKAGARLRATVLVNLAKWQAAEIYCRKAKIQFRVITEMDMFKQTGAGKTLKK